MRNKTGSQIVASSQIKSESEIVSFLAQLLLNLIFESLKTAWKTNMMVALG